MRTICAKASALQLSHTEATKEELRKSQQKDRLERLNLVSLVLPWAVGCERNMAMAEETEYD